MQATAPEVFWLAFLCYSPSEGKVLGGQECAVVMNGFLAKAGEGGVMLVLLRESSEGIGVGSRGMAVAKPMERT